ncbi:Fungal transcriptional regulatory protein [Tolypocladium paradoxum]|uniref:Fungal transcriptional regulatory protein n=1 Tax=Tolypocladium paradoxum TaxID=94208 RepID=A0A2S4KLN3_9HYPO|nr:Fungal transcriptional regulatory protein [Tolypocladium paradoxum]
MSQAAQEMRRKAARCVFLRDLDAPSALEGLARTPPSVAGHGLEGHRQETSDPSASRSSTTPDRHTSSFLALTSQQNGPRTELSKSQPTVVAQQMSPPDGSLQLQDAAWLACSPDTLPLEQWTADFASTRWLDLLASDAAQADSGFSLAPSPAQEDNDGGPRHRRATASVHASPALLNGQAQLPENLDPEFERIAWQSAGDVVLSDHEAVLFRHFADRCAPWLDVLDPQKLFSTYAIRLALRNMGLMKAVLALSAKHRSKSIKVHAPESQDVNDPRDCGGDGECVGYYYETLHYVREALTYPSYSHSEELLATALVISAYEMLDESDGSGNWQRHLKGIFWIQRSQDVDGACGGLRQAVWWAWIRQDIWAAFREKRPCLSFWSPVKNFHELDQHELADWAIYLLSQAVNYSAYARDAEATSSLDPLASMQLKGRRDDLLSRLERWKACLGDEYKTLPTPTGPSDVFTPLWVHPPQFGVALQAYSFAQILIALHSPNSTGFNGYLKLQKTLSEAVNTICGIAMELKDESCQIMSAQYLYGAGLCVQDQEKQDKIISMISSCEERVGWAPMATWRDDLRQEWARADKDPERRI